MNIIDPVQTAFAPSRFSHRLARGLRRELFREFQDRDCKWRTLIPTVALVITARMDARERVRSLRRLAPRMRTSLAAYHEQSSNDKLLAAGTSLNPVKHACAGGETEDAVRISEVRVHVADGRASFCSKPVALISQHAIERIFERLATMELAAAQTELASALAWFDLLHSACQSLSYRTRPRQFAVPTETGVFLGQRCHDSGLLQVRTWVAMGNNNRLYRTLATLHAWRATPTSDTARTFRSLLAQPCNQWMNQPYSRGY